MALGLIGGIASAAGQAETARKNAKMIKEETRLKYAAIEREFLVEADASNKEAYQAHLEGQRGESFARAKGNGMRGSTAGLQAAEQSRQAALSIENAKDRKDAATANYVFAGKEAQIGAQNRINVNTPSPMQSFLTVVSGAFG